MSGGWKPDSFACRVEQLWQQDRLEVIIVVGHADSSEENPFQLSEQRAEKVKEQFVALGLPERQIYTEGKGATQPVLRGTPGQNRRVDIEAIGSTGGKPIVECQAGLGKLFAELPLPEAVAAARGRVQNGSLAVRVPAATAMNMQRKDLLEAFLNDQENMKLDAEDRLALMRMAITAGDTESVERLMAFGVKIDEFEHPAHPIIWAACGIETKKLSESERIRMVKVLLPWGARADGVPLRNFAWRKKSALQCSANENLIRLTELLLANGANPNLPKEDPPLIVAAKYPDMVRILLAAGADVNVRLSERSNAVTLFHMFRFVKPEDVAWFVDLGLDINARTHNGLTPLQFALRYASPEVLDAFIYHGAQFGEGRSARLAADNLPGLLWLLSKGVPLENDPGTAIRVAQEGDVAIPVIEELYRRGVNLCDRDKNGQTPLHAAIAALSSSVVKRLVELSCIGGAEEAMREREFAEKQAVYRFFPCLDCDSQQRQRKREEDRLMEPQWQLKKDQIISILKAEEERLRQLQ